MPPRDLGAWLKRVRPLGSRTLGPAAMPEGPTQQSRGFAARNASYSLSGSSYFRCAYLMYLTDPSVPERFKQLAAHSFSPTWVADNTPATGWPEGDGPQMHRYSSVAPPVEPEDDGVVPPLVLRARQMGLDV